MKVQHYSPHNSNPNSPKNNKVLINNFIPASTETYDAPLQRMDNSDKAAVTKNLQEYFKGDEYGNSILSLEMEEENFKNIKNIFNLENLSDTEMLREFASSMCNESYREEFNIEVEPARRIFVEATDKLLLLGEDTTDLIEHYNLFS